MATHKTFKSLGAAIGRYGKTIEEQTNRVVIEVAIDVAHNVIRSTPVDTGRARSNWVPKVGSPPSHTRNPFAPGRHLGIGENGNARAALTNAQTVFATRKPGGGALYLKNNLPYIARLNEGYSKQAPSGFVQSSIATALTIITKQKLLKD